MPFQVKSVFVHACELCDEFKGIFSIPMTYSIKYQEKFKDFLDFFCFNGFNQQFFMHLELMSVKHKGQELRTVLSAWLQRLLHEVRRGMPKSLLLLCSPVDIAAFMARTRIVHALQNGQPKIADFELFFVFVCELIFESNIIFRTRIT